MRFQKLRFFLYGLALSAALYAFPIQASQGCAGHASMTLQLIHSGYGLLSTAMTAQHEIIQIFVHRNSRDWVIIGVDDESKPMKACLLVRGSNWIYTFEQPI